MMPSLGISTSRIKKTTLMSVVLMTTLMMMAMNMKEVNGQQTTRTCYVGHAGSGAPGCGNTSLTPCNTIAECLVNMSSDTQIIINSYSVLQGAGFCGITNVGANTTYSLTISGGFSQVYCPSTFFISWVVGIQQYVTISNLRLNQCTGNSQGCISVLSSIEAPQIMDSNNVGFLSLQSVTIVLSSNRGVYTGPGVNLFMLSCSISGNPWMYSPQGGCALASWNATLQFSQFSSCSAQNGGAIYVGYALTTSSNTFSYNSAQYYGGAIYLHAPMSLSMYADQMFSNTANQVGGAIAVGLAEIPGSAASVLWSFNRVSFFDNTASYAGALSLSSNTILVPVTVNSGYFNQNTGSYLAGGIFTEGCNLTIINSYFESNMAEYGSGGAIEVNSGSLAVNYCDFFDNKARGSRGAAINSNSQTVVSNSFFENNVAQMGAAISFYSFSSNLIVLDSSFDNNAAENQGGAIYLYGSQLLATDCQFSENSAASGGALYIVPSQITQDMFAGSTFTKNKATYYGGAIYFENFDYEGELFTLPPMSHNTAKSGGAIYYEGFPPAATGIMGFNSAPQIACFYDDACPSGKKVSSCSQCSCLCAMGAETICYDNCY